MIIWSLFFGAILDQYAIATKLMLAWIGIIAIVSVIFHIFNIIYFTLSKPFNA